MNLLFKLNSIKIVFLVKVKNAIFYLRPVLIKFIYVYILKKFEVFAKNFF